MGIAARVGGPRPRYTHPVLLLVASRRARRQFPPKSSPQSTWISRYLDARAPSMPRAVWLNQPACTHTTTQGGWLHRYFWIGRYTRHYTLTSPLAHSSRRIGTHRARRLGRSCKCLLVPCLSTTPERNQTSSSPIARTVYAKRQKAAPDVIQWKGTWVTHHLSSAAGCFRAFLVREVGHTGTINSTAPIRAVQTRPTPQPPPHKCQDGF